MGVRITILCGFQKPQSHLTVKLGTYRGRKYLLSLLIAFSASCLYSQEKAPPIELNGYVTTMQSVMFDSISGPFMNENLIHNRLNFKGYINDNITIGAGIRNRLFTGDMVRLGSYYSGLIGADPGKADMSWNLIDEQSFLLNTTIDRLWLDLSFDKVQLTIGASADKLGSDLCLEPE